MMETISNREAIEMMNRCKHEIQSLRAENNRLGPKAEAYDNISLILGLLPEKHSGMSEDIIWVINKRIQELTPVESGQEQP